MTTTAALLFAHLVETFVTFFTRLSHVYDTLDELLLRFFFLVALLFLFFFFFLVLLAEPLTSSRHHQMCHLSRFDARSRGYARPVRSAGTRVKFLQPRHVESHAVIL